MLLHESLHPGRRWGAVVLLCALAGGYELFFLPDRQTFVSYEYRAIRLRSMATGLDVGPRFDLGPLVPGVFHPLLLPDGKTLLVGTDEGLVLRFHVAR